MEYWSNGVLGERTRRINGKNSGSSPVPYPLSPEKTYEIFDKLRRMTAELLSPASRRALLTAKPDVSCVIEDEAKNIREDGFTSIHFSLM